jgi:hypothetical protein
MLQHQNIVLTLLFILTTLISVWLIIRASDNNKTFTKVLITWLIAQAILSLAGFYTHTEGLPPRFMLMILPPLVSIIVLFSTFAGRRWLDTFNIVRTTWMHVVHLPVEICFFWLFTLKLVPQSMTFEGGNFDIFSGITAPLVAIAIRRNSIKRSWAIVWNFLCLCLLFNVV